MNNTFLSYHFWFEAICFEQYHYTDNRKGCPRHYLAYMEKGTSKIVSRDRTIEIKPGEIFYIPKGLSYQSYWASEDEIRFKSFGFDLFPEGNRAKYKMQKIGCGAEIAEEIKRIPTNTPVTSEILGIFYSALAHILEFMEEGETNQKKQILEKAKNYMRRKPECKVSEVAKHCLVSESVLYEIFKNEEGITPNTLRQKILCEKAVSLLSTTDRPVQEISEVLGFSSTSYFRKQLHKHVGMTPREIRKTAASL